MGAECIGGRPPASPPGRCWGRRALWPGPPGEGRGIVGGESTHAAEHLAKKKDLPALERVRLEWFEEGRCAQVMHIGPYSAEGPTIERLHAFIHERGYSFDGRHQKHHEIYMGDPRRAAPESLKTI